jgi:drug/metabolite transporter (DMT)-like permease
MNTRNIALLAAFSTAIIYGVSYTVAKDLMPTYVPPFALIFFRVFGAAILFWITSLFVRKEKIESKDYFRILIAAIFGTSINMLCFYKGLNYTTPITASAIGVATPIMVMVFAAVLLKEKLVKNKIIGLVIGLIGAFVLITYKNDLQQVENAVFGNFLVFVNAAFYGLYLVVVKQLLVKYHPLNVIKWMYLLGVFFVLPFAYPELIAIDWDTMPQIMYVKLGYVIVFSTFFNYLFNLFALSKLKPTTVSVFVYLHPVFASIYALFVKSDTLSFVKVSATLLIFVGVYMVSKPVRKN